MLECLLLNLRSDTTSSTHPHTHTHTHTCIHTHTHTHTCIHTHTHTHTQLYSQLQDDNVGWSDSLYLLDSITHDDQFRDSASSPSTNENSVERETTPFGPDKTTPSNKDTTPIRTVPPDRQNSTQTQDSLGVPKSHHHTNHSPHATVNGHLTEAFRVFAQEDSMATELNEDAFSEDKASFCDCPPDPEIPREISLQHLTYVN